MKLFLRSLACVSLATLPVIAPPLAAQRNAGGRPVHNEQARADRWVPVTMPYNAAALSPRERQMVAKLADACRLLDELYWHQSDLGGLAMYHATQSPVLARLFAINGSRYDLVDGNEAFIGEAVIPPGRELYPFGLKREEIESYVVAHPDQRAAIYNPLTVVRGSKDHLETVPYHVAFAQWLKPMAQDLREAAALSPDPAFAHFLTLRADALLSDDYYASDVAWVDLKNPKVDLILAPYETYLDNLLGVKGSFGGAILIRDEAGSRKLDRYVALEDAMQGALPLDAADKPSVAGHAGPMEVMDAPLRAGDLRYGYQAVADNLPNDARIHAEKGTKKLFFRNFMDARVNTVVLPIAARLMVPAQARQVTGQGYLTFTVLHELSHGLGPAYAHVNGHKIDIREAIGSNYAGLEESKADICGMFLANWLVSRGEMTPTELQNVYASYVAGLLRTMRFSTAEAHGKADLMVFDFLLEKSALKRNTDGRYTFDPVRMPSAIAELAHALLEFEARGDRAGVEAWYQHYGSLPPGLADSFDSVKDLPVDVFPEFELNKGVRP